MKWWKYSWAAVSDIIFIIVLSIIFSNIPDSNSQKLLAAGVAIYLCVIGTGWQLTRQIGAGFIATMTVLNSMVKNSARLREGDDEEETFREELETAVSKFEKTIQERDVKILIHGCFSLIILIWMLFILLANPY